MKAQEKNKVYFPSPLRLVFGAKGLVFDPLSTEIFPSGVVLINNEKESTLTLAAGQCLALSPLEILFTGSNKKQLNLMLGQSARLTLIEKYENKEPQEIDMRINLAAQAKLIHGQILGGEKKSVHKAHVLVTANKGAYYDSFVFMAGEIKASRNTEIRLEGELAEARLLGAQILRGHAKVQTSWQVKHLASHGVSHQILKTVLDDDAQGFFTGLVHVAQGAQKTDGSQLSRALLLSDTAEMQAKPELEIYADDVKCSHGATSGDLDDEALFYLRSRGIEAKEARAMLIRAFIDEVVNQIQSEEIRAAVYAEVEKEMPL